MSTGNMSEPIDYIDLTIDSPVRPAQRSQRSQYASVSNNRTVSRPSERKAKKSQTENRSDCVVLLPTNKKSEDVRSLEATDKDNVNINKKADTLYVKELDEKESITLTCPICYEELSPNRIPMSTPCGHLFCNQCLQMAFRKAKRCPKCQRSLKIKSCIRLYY